ncbi:MAG: hypothetical protein COX62_08210 [Deltaproteobacteria bacterium CG_4_10_14_0_2_um_filter_43_8]|nr:MAG: hypothetical protein COV43_07860 [Deltaproteobacteria bacterium CG11_big_fil_rev_8_21_14_0_20_42_23]PJA18773.1 MAG: hypothetical protein COX62_08210 [Deltaproteobacteria bacterium CG_4_10_14_0_2_um_filter_43_8]PJC63907.1 MAG: hypothetical protein CO021_07015 [Deltaproteobacteria bacterium CG_4_9_14_0_2_um_filter_42_21]
MLNKDEKLETIPMENLLRPSREKRGRSSRSKVLWDDLILPTQKVTPAEGKKIESPVASQNQEMTSKPQVQSTPSHKTFSKSEPITSAKLPLKSASKIGSKQGLNIGSKVGSTFQNRFENRVNSGSDVGSNLGSVSSELNRKEINLLTRGIGGKLVQYLYWKSLSNEAGGAIQVSLKDFSVHLGVKYEGLKTSVRRLLENGLLQKESSSKGRSGFIAFSLPVRSREGLQAHFQPQPFMHNLPENPVLNWGQNSVQPSPYSSSNYNTTTIKATAEPNLEPNNIPPQFHEFLSTLNLREYGLRSQSQLAPYLGEGKVCEAPLELEEFFHKFDAVITDREARGMHIGSKTALLLSCFKKGWITVPEGYLSLEEERLQEQRRESEIKLKKLREHKVQLYQTNFELFKEELSEEKKKNIFDEVKEEQSTMQNGIGATKATIDKVINAEYNNRLRTMFLNTLDNREEVVSLLKW